jgi:copper transport protein
MQHLGITVRAPHGAAAPLWWRRLGRALAALLVVLAVPVGLAGPAAAHAELVSTSPADGSSFEQAPTRLTLTFATAVGPDGASAVIRGTDGVEHRMDLTTPSGDLGTVLVGAIPPLPRDAYRLDWTAVADDGHQGTGTVSFSVGVAAAQAAPTAAGPAAAESAVRLLGYAGLALALGPLLLLLLVRRRTGRPGVPDRPEGWERHLASLALAGTLLLVAGVGALIVTTSCPPALATAMLGLAASAAVAVALGRTGEPRAMVAAVGLVLGLAVLLPAATHLGNEAGSAPVLAAAVHVAAAGAWVGGLVALAVVVLPSWRTPQVRDAVTAVAAGFAWLAVPAVTLLAATGVALTGVQVATVDGLVTTPYGLLVVAKVALLLLAGLLGLRHALGARRGSRSTPSARSVALEAGVVVVVVALGAALTTAQPPRGEAWTPVERTVARPTTILVDHLLVTSSVGPTAVGAALVTVRPIQVLAPVPGPITGATATLEGPDGGATSVPLTLGSDGLFTAPVRLEQPGVVRLRTAVHRTGLADAVSTTTWVVSAAGADRPPVVSTTRLWPGAPAAALLLLLLGAVALGLMVASRRRRPVDPTPADDVDLTSAGMRTRT